MQEGPLILARAQPKQGEESRILAGSAPRFACRVSGSSFSRFPAPVGTRFQKYAIYIYQNAQNEALSVVQRFNLSNY